MPLSGGASAGTDAKPEAERNRRNSHSLNTARRFHRSSGTPRRKFVVMKLRITCRLRILPAGQGGAAGRRAS